MVTANRPERDCYCNNMQSLDVIRMEGLYVGKLKNMPPFSTVWSPTSRVTDTVGTMPMMSPFPGESSQESTAEQE